MFRFIYFYLIEIVFSVGVPKDFLYLEIDFDNYAVAYHCDDYFGVYHTR